MSPPARPEPSTRRALAFVYAGYAFRYLFLLILVPFYARVLGAAEYGRLLTAMGLFQIVWLVTEYGFPAAGVRDAARSRTRTEDGALYALHVQGRLVMLAPALAIGVAGTFWSPLLRERPEFGALATLLGVVAAFNMGWYFQGRLAFVTSVLLEVLGFALSLPLILWLVDGPERGALVLVALVLSGLVCTVLGHALALRSLSLAGVHFRGGLSLVRDSSALFVHRGVGLIVASSTTYLVSLFASPAEVGFYGAAERIAGVGLSLLQPANQVLIGTVSRRLGEPRDEAAGFALMRQALVVLTGFGCLMLVVCLTTSHFAVPLVLGREFTPSVAILGVLCLSFPFAAFSQVLSGQVLIPLRLDGAVSRAGIGGALSTLGLVIALGYAFGGVGVACARSLGALVGACLLVRALSEHGLVPRLFGRTPALFGVRLRGNGT